MPSYCLEILTTLFFLCHYKDKRRVRHDSADFHSVEKHLARLVSSGTGDGYLLRNLQGLLRIKAFNKARLFLRFIRWIKLLYRHFMAIAFLFALGQMHKNEIDRKQSDNDQTIE